jgi:hypothetical protein
MKRAAGVIMAFVCALPVAVAHAQDSTRASCPVDNGLAVSFSTGDTARSPARDQRAPGLTIDADNVIDTTWTFNIAERRWSRPYFTASVGAGWSSDAKAVGTTTAPGSPNVKGWSACVGVAIGMRNPTLVLRGARGLVHLRADVRSLSRIDRRSARDSTSQPRR